jgi:two-component sensor histidine kinase
VLLQPAAAQPLVLALHELATNATTHGSLSTSGGRVAIDWSVSRSRGSSALRLLWQEFHGPPVRPPEGFGFGTTAINAFLKDDLGATVDLTFPPDGVACRIDLPAEQLTTPTKKRHRSGR